LKWYNTSMDDFKLKLILSILAGVAFSLLFILLAFAMPLPKKEHIVIKKPKGKLEQISHTLRNQ